MKSMILKISISVICIILVAAIFLFGDDIAPMNETNYNGIGESSTYIDAFRFDTEELRYDGNGKLNLLEGVRLEGYTSEELKNMVFTKIYAGDTLSEKIIQYTADTEAGTARSVRKLKLYGYSKPKINIPDELPTVTRRMIGKFGSLLETESQYSVDDGFGNDAREHVEIRCEGDDKDSSLVHYILSFRNMFGDEDVQKIDVILSGEPAFLTLTDSEIKLRKGESFYPATYIEKAELANGNDAREMVLYSGDIDTSQAGIYEIVYELEDIEMMLTVDVS